uniref:MBL fold metallo-hydrolase n=1 Tax=Sporomusa silvacetica TaxID=55504 RepID=UPI00146E9AAE|nr:MBL fold metallo-hydrolase [Sporomusa silvacetica]
MREPGIAFDELPLIHLVVVSHNHYDHMDLSTLKHLKEKISTRFLVPSRDKRLLISEGIENLNEMDWWQAPPDVSVTFAPTQHSSARGLFDRNKSLWGSYMIDLNGKKIYFGGDAAYSYHYQEIRNRLGAPHHCSFPYRCLRTAGFHEGRPHESGRCSSGSCRPWRNKIYRNAFWNVSANQRRLDAPVQELEKAMIQTKLEMTSFIIQKECVTQIHNLKTPSQSIAFQQK